MKGLQCYSSNSGWAECIRDGTAISATILNLSHRRMKTLKIRKTTLLVLMAVFMLYELILLQRKYGKLFYIQTYLPSPNLPLQYRRIKESGNRLESTGTGQPSPKVLCLIITSPKYHETRALHVAATWARHCSRSIFITSETDSRLADSYVVPEAAGYNDLWTKVSKSFRWVYDEGLLSSFDWVLKADDDTFVFMENLRQALEPFDSSHLVAAGHKLFTWETSEVYLNGGAGYVLSKASVTELVNKGLKEGSCAKSLDLGTSEDVNMGLCLSFVGVTLLDFKDSEGNTKFHIYPPIKEVDPRQEYVWSHLWLKVISVRPYPFGFRNLTSQPISFHYVDGESMYLIYYLAYIIHSDRGSVTSEDAKKPTKP